MSLDCELPEIARSPASGGHSPVALSPKPGRHGLDMDDGDAKLPSLVLVTDAVVEHYWSSVRRKVRRQNTDIRRRRRKEGWDGLLRLSKEFAALSAQPRWRSIVSGQVDTDMIADAFMRAIPQYNTTMPRLLSALHFLFQFRVAPAVVYEKNPMVDPGVIPDGDELRPVTADTAVSSLFSNELSTPEQREFNKIDRSLLHAVKKYFDGFDLDRSGTIDWRELVIRLRPLLKPLDTPAQHLEYAFELYTANQERHSASKKAALMRRKNHLLPPPPSSLSSPNFSSEVLPLNVSVPSPSINMKAKSVAALIRSPPRIHPELSLESACRLLGLFLTTEIDELRAFDISRRAYEALPEALREVRHAKPVVTSVAFREMMTPEMSDSARERRSASARSIALKEVRDSRKREIQSSVDEEDTESVCSEASSVPSEATLALREVRRHRAGHWAF